VEDKIIEQINTCSAEIIVVRLLETSLEAVVGALFVAGMKTPLPASKNKKRPL